MLRHIGSFANANRHTLVCLSPAVRPAFSPVLSLPYLIKLNPTVRGVKFYGAGDRDRTGDTRYHKPMLYHLSYARHNCFIAPWLSIFCPPSPRLRWTLIFLPTRHTSLKLRVALLRGNFFAVGGLPPVASQTRRVVELIRLELTTPCMPCKCSTN